MEPTSSNNHSKSPKECLPHNLDNLSPAKYDPLPKENKKKEDSYSTVTSKTKWRV
jgi:hypothetical protein